MKKAISKDFSKYVAFNILEQIAYPATELLISFFA